MTAVTATVGARAATATMRAAIHDRYGRPDAVVATRDVPMPEIGDDGVLVRVHAASVNALDWHMVRGQPIIARFGGGFLRPKDRTSGVDVAGVVEAVGKDVTELRVGEEVFGNRDGSFAEYSAGRVRNYVPKPGNLTVEEAAAIPVAAVTALQAVRDHAALQAGQRVLVLGAGGGVGSYAAQIAKAFGGRVTAATSPANLEMVRGFGVDEVVDYTAEDPLRRGPFDAILDVGGYRSNRDMVRAIVPGGVVVGVGAGDSKVLSLVAGIVSGTLRSRFRGQRIVSFLAKTNRDDLQVLAGLATEGKLRPVIDRTYPLAAAGEAISYVETGQARGKVVIAVP